VRNELIKNMNILLKKHNRKEVVSLEDWKKFPISSKEMLNEITPKKFIDVRYTSGSSGKQKLIFCSKEGVRAYEERTRIFLIESKISSRDLVLNLFAYGNFRLGSLYEKSLMELEIPVIPLGGPHMFPKKEVIAVVKELRPSVWCGVPSYIVYLIKNIQDSYVFPEKVLFHLL